MLDQIERSGVHPACSRSWTEPALVLDLIYLIGDASPGFETALGYPRHETPHTDRIAADARGLRQLGLARDGTKLAGIGVLQHRELRGCLHERRACGLVPVGRSYCPSLPIA